MTNTNKVEQLIARKLATWDAYVWQNHPTNDQRKRQTKYERRARELIDAIRMDPAYDVVSDTLDATGGTGHLTAKAASWMADKVFGKERIREQRMVKVAGALMTLFQDEGYEPEQGFDALATASAVLVLSHVKTYGEPKDMLPGFWHAFFQGTFDMTYKHFEKFAFPPMTNH